VETDQGQLKLLVGQELGQLKNDEFDPRVVLEKGDKTLHANGLGLKQCYP
jgi:hypothetical protein